ncbi:MAG: DivIVA domain-containing protein [Bifidobacteriaceae bacterium]|jgi:DivIVA domain-containing protein|nr:DivIVA domain-containing protein [Bifidobacteriaceae bacterium]
MSDKQVQGAEEQAPVIDLAGNRKWGYKVSEVDDFLARAHDLYEREEPALTQEEIQLQSFDLEKNGYVIGQVDATLVRLERAVADKQTQWDLLHEGRGAWQSTTRDLAETLRARAEREPRDRFKAGLKKTPSYDRKQVDVLVDQAWAHISENLGLSPAATEKPKGADDVDTVKVANVIFTQRKGPRGYDEASVDAYLNRVIQVLTRLESIERVMRGQDEVIADQPPVAVPPSTSGNDSDFIAAAGASGEVAEAIPVSEQASSLASLVSAEPRETVPLSDAEKTSVDNDALPPSFAPQSRSAASPDALMPEAVSPANEAPRPETEVEEAQSSPLPAPAVPVPAASAAPASVDANQPSVTPAASPASAAVPSVGEVPLPAGGFAAGTSQLQQEESVVNADSESAQVPDAPETSNAQPSQTQPGENPDEYLSSLLSSTSVQTSSFEIPNLTFPTVPGASVPLSEPSTEESGADSEEKSKDSEESTNG